MRLGHFVRFGRACDGLVEAREVAVFVGGFREGAEVSLLLQTL
jgi:hypothetical protein